MVPSGQILAYEFAFDDVNPPVHAILDYWHYLLNECKRLHTKSVLMGIQNEIPLATSLPGPVLSAD